MRANAAARTSTSAAMLELAVLPVDEIKFILLAVDA